MTAGALALAEALLRLGFRAWEAHQAVHAAEVEGLTPDQVAGYIDGISIGDADVLIGEGAASSAAG